MLRKRLSLILLLGVGMAVGGWLFFSGAGGPKYQGKPVRYWFREYCQPSGDVPRAEHHRKQATEALLRIGTNALPYLLEQAMNPAPNTARRQVYYKLMSLLPRSWGTREYASREEIRRYAVNWIGSNRPPANLVLPRLRQALAQPNTPQYGWAISVLAHTAEGLAQIAEGREKLVPYLAPALQATNGGVCLEVVACLTRLGPKAAAAAVPELIQALRTADRTNVLFQPALELLGDIGSNAAPAISLLQDSFAAETNLSRRLELAAALCRIDPGQTEAFSFLAGSLTNQQNSTAQARYAAGLLGSLGNSAEAAVPAFLQAVDTTDKRVWLNVLESWDKSGVPRDQLLPKLRPRFKSEDELWRLAAATYILTHAPGDTEALSVLVDPIKSHSRGEAFAIARIADLGTNALAAAPLLMEAFNGSNVMAMAQVAMALKKMGLPRDLCRIKLNEKLGEMHSPARSYLAAAILDIDPGDPSAQAALMDQIKARSSFERYAIIALGIAGPAAKGAIPLLRQELKRPNSDIQKAATQAIEAIEAEKGTN